MTYIAGITSNVSDTSPPHIGDTGSDKLGGHSGIQVVTPDPSAVVNEAEVIAVNDLALRCSVGQCRRISPGWRAPGV